MLFINTRPVDRAEALTQYLRQADIEVVDLPLLALQALDFTPQLKQQFQQLEQVQAIVVVSPTAVDIGMQYLQQSAMSLAQLQHVEWIAVGQTTAATLARYAVEAWVPELETSEGMLSLPFFVERTDLTQIAFWRGVGGRQFMMQQCLQRNIQVLNVKLYQRACPISTPKQFQQLLAVLKSGSQPQLPRPFWMCISSEASWKNWLELCQFHPDVLEQGHYLVLGTRLYQILQHDKNARKLNFNITQLTNLGEHTVLQTLQQLQNPL